MCIRDRSTSVQFKFIADDAFYDGDDGSGGSLVEAAVDNFKIQYVGDVAASGDINNDGSINVVDVILVVNMILGTSESDLVAADLNADGQINVLDIVIIIDLILNDN